MRQLRENFVLKRKGRRLQKEYQRLMKENAALLAENLKLKEFKNKVFSDTAPSDSTFLASCEDALERARATLANAIYQSECGENAGLRTIFSNQANWLSRVVYLASLQFEQLKN